MKDSRWLVRSVIADVRKAIPGVTRECLAEVLAGHFDDPAAIEDELDRSFGPPEGAEG